MTTSRIAMLSARRGGDRRYAGLRECLRPDPLDVRDRRRLDVPCLPRGRAGGRAG
jgi:hypothetical protein